MDIAAGFVDAGIAIFSAAVAVGAASATTRGHARRLARLEKLSDEATKDYVPRNEIELALRNIEQSTRRTHDLFHAFVYAGGDRGLTVRAMHAAAADPEHPDDTAVDIYIAGPCPRFEGFVPWFYLDTRGNVTIGTGNLVPDVAAALKLPLRSNDGSWEGGCQVTKDFMRVHRMAPGKRPAFYQCPTSPMITSADNAQLLRARCYAFEKQLCFIFERYDSFPLDARIALLDLIYNLGLGHPPTTTTIGRGLQMFTHLCAAVRAERWEDAALLCARNVHDPNNAFAARNAWTRAQFLSAAHEANGMLPTVSASAAQLAGNVADYLNDHGGTVVFVFHQVASAAAVTMPEAPPRTFADFWMWARDFSHQFSNLRVHHYAAPAPPEEPVSHPKP